MGNPLCMDKVCRHARTQVIARRDGVDYLRCLDCGQILEEEDLEQTPAFEDEEPVR